MNSGQINLGLSICRKWNNKLEVVVPGFSEDKFEPCTAIFDVQKEQWRKLNTDSRSAPFGGEIMRHVHYKPLFTQYPFEYFSL